jgi:hypothetical protein
MCVYKSLIMRSLQTQQIQLVDSLYIQGAKLLGKFQINNAVFGFLLYFLLKRGSFVGLV